MTHDFDECLEFSHAQEDQPFWGEVYRAAFGTSLRGFYSVRQDGWAQRAGIDRHVCLADGTVLKIDEKVRKETWPDILLEVFSDQARRTPGWAHPQKLLTCDYIAYAMLPSQTCYLLPYQLLRRAVNRYGEDWWLYADGGVPGYRWIEARNNGYITRSLTVPTEILLDTIRECLIVRWG